MSNDVRMENWEEFEREMESLTRRDQLKVLNRAMRPAFRAVLRNARRAAPKDTGALRKGIKMKKASRRSQGPDGIAFVIFSTAPHSHLVEYGHRTQNGGTVAAVPFIRRTFDAARESLIEAITRAFVRDLG